MKHLGKVMADAATVIKALEKENGGYRGVLCECKLLHSPNLARQHRLTINNNTIHTTTNTGALKKQLAAADKKMKAQDKRLATWKESGFAASTIKALTQENGPWLPWLLACDFASRSPLDPILQQSRLNRPTT